MENNKKSLMYCGNLDKLSKVSKDKFQEIETVIFLDKIHGLSDAEIGKKYGITYCELEKIIRKMTGLSLSAIKPQKKIKTLFPKIFEEEKTTIWSFKDRGKWATHSGEYRGNWSPYIPRNVILKYSKPKELVLDYFCGAGTTAVEAKLLGRRCIAIDINEKAIQLAKSNVNLENTLKESLSQEFYEPELFVGDARDLSFLKDNSVDLICAHPPYANIIQYTESNENDLSHYDVEHFLKEMEKIAKESLRVLKPGRQCAILIGDMRRHKHIIPLGFKLIDVFISTGFKLKELIIKRQHNCKTTGFWYKNSIKYNFLLLAHEYLPIFEKLNQNKEIKEEGENSFLGLKCFPHKDIESKEKLKEFETTTVWIFPEDSFEDLLHKNVIERYTNNKSYQIIELDSEKSKHREESILKRKEQKNLLFIKYPFLDRKDISFSDILIYLEKLKELILTENQFIKDGGYIVIQTKDERIRGYIETLAKYIIKSVNLPKLSLKEIVIVTTENQKKIEDQHSSHLEIVHQYLLIYEKETE